MEAPHKFGDRVSFIKAPETVAESDARALEGTVREVLVDVRQRGDAALRHYSRIFDREDIDKLEVSNAEREKAVASLDRQTREDTEFAISQVRNFAQAQMATLLPLDVETLPGIHLGHRIIPI